MPQSAAETRSEGPAGDGIPPNLDPSRRRWEWVLLLLLGLLSALLLAQLLDFGYGRDQALYSVVSDALLRGHALYRDAWDFKPPGIYFTYAFARVVFGKSFTAVRILEASGLVSLFFAYALFSRRHVGSRRPGILGAAAAILAYVPLEFWYTGQPEGFGAIALAWALVCATYEPSPSAGRRGEIRQYLAWAGAASLYTVAALFKPPLGGGVLVSFAIVLASRWKAKEALGWARALGPPTLAFAVGGMLPLLVALAYFTATDTLADLYEALFVFTPRYTALGFEVKPLPALFWRALFEWLFRTAPYNVVGIAALLFLPALHPRERLAVVHVLGVIAFSLLGIALQAKFFLYHYAAVLPLTGLLAGWGYWKLWIWTRRSALVGLATVAVLAAVTLDAVPGLPSLRPFWIRTEKRLSTVAQPALRTPVRDALYSLGDVDARSNREVAEWLRRNTPEDSTLFIWGFEPAIYELSGRRPASRYVHDVPQRAAWAKDKSRRILIEELTASPPAAIVVVHGDRLPWVTGNRKDSYETLRDFPELSEILRSRYRPVKQIDDLEIQLRDDL